MRPQYCSRALVLPILAGALCVLPGCSESPPPAPLVTVSPAAPRAEGARVSVRSLGARQTFVREEPEVKPRRRRRRPRRREEPKKVVAPVEPAAEAPAEESAPEPVPEVPEPAPRPAEPRPDPAPEPPKDPGVGTASFFYGSSYDPYRLNLPPGRRRTR